MLMGCAAGGYAARRHGDYLNYPWGIRRHGQKMSRTVFSDMKCRLRHVDGVSTDAHDAVERSVNRSKKTQ